MCLSAVCLKTREEVGEWSEGVPVGVGLLSHQEAWTRGGGSHSIVLRRGETGLIFNKGGCLPWPFPGLQKGSRQVFLLRLPSHS